MQNYKIHLHSLSVPVLHWNNSVVELLCECCSFKPGGDLGMRRPLVYVTLGFKDKTQPSHYSENISCNCIRKAKWVKAILTMGRFMNIHECWGERKFQFLFGAVQSVSSCTGLKQHKFECQFTRRTSMQLQVTFICVESDGHKRPGQKGSQQKFLLLFIFIHNNQKGSDWCTYRVTIIYALSPVTFYIKQDPGIINFNYSYIIGINQKSPGRPKVKINLNQWSSICSSQPLENTYF